MPTVFRIDGYRFFFWSNENTEPPHVHVEKGGGHAKFWLKDGKLVSSSGFKPADLRRIRAILIENMDTISEQWNAYFGQSN